MSDPPVPTTNPFDLPENENRAPRDDDHDQRVAAVERSRSVKFSDTIKIADDAGLTLTREKSTEKNKTKRSNESPPPPPAYHRGVSFDTFDNRDATDYSLTLNYKHNDYVHTRRSRTFLCGTDQNDYSDFALEWLLDELIDDGDEVVCLRAVEKDSKVAGESSIAQGLHRQEAEKLLKCAVERNTEDKAISLVMELAVGKVQDMIQRMIEIYEPAVLIVGTKGRHYKGVQGLMPGSVSKYCLQQSPIPVIVVRSNVNRQKKKQKRLADPSRKSYSDMLRLSEARGSRHFVPTDPAHSSAIKLSDDEAAEVAKAIGLPRDLPSRPASNVDPESRRTSISSAVSNPPEATGAYDKHGDDGSIESEKAPVTGENSSDPSFVSDVEAGEKTPQGEQPKTPVVAIQRVATETDAPPVDVS